MIDPVRPRRPIRSFVRREGRMTDAQRRALVELAPRYVVASDGPFDFPALFGRIAPVVLEIGFGDGTALLALAAAHPERDFLGIEVHRPGIGALLLRLESLGLTNVRACEGDAVQMLAQAVPDTSLDAVHVFFPDPWPKARHHKRRLVQPAFVELVRCKLKQGGVLHVATDWAPYAQDMLVVLSACHGLRNTADGFAPRPAGRPLTKFERRGERLGHSAYDMVFERVDEVP